MPLSRELHGDLRHLLTNPWEFPVCAVPEGRVSWFRSRSTGTVLSLLTAARTLLISASSSFPSSPIVKEVTKDIKPLRQYSVRMMHVHCPKEVSAAAVLPTRPRAQGAF